MRFRITPQNTSFYGHFTVLAEHVLRGAQLLQQALGSEQDREAAVAQMKDIEHDGDHATHAIMHAANTSFITPFDRDDIYALASRLDDCIDHIEATLDIVVLYGVKALPKGVTKQLDVILRMSELTAEAMPRLRSMKDLQGYWIEINRLENEADQVYRRMLADLFNGQSKAVDIIRLKAVIDELEAAADAFETVANTVESIAVKES